MTAPNSSTTERWMWMLHGLLGSRSNWRAIATQLVAARPGWGAILPDLRMHGQSQHCAPPHSIDSAAQDLIELETHLGIAADAILGHSFGGKVALSYLDRVGRPLSECWIIDSPPGPRADPAADDTTLRVIARMRSLPATFESRNAFVEQITEGGFDESLARWLALNLVRREGGLSLRVDLSAITDLLESHYQSDLWPVVEARCTETPITFVIGGRSTVFVPAQRERAQQLHDAGKLRVITLADAGHWVHADAPDALLAHLIAGS